MRVFNDDQMKHLSFPDAKVEEMEFLPDEKRLKIVVDGAFLDLEDGIRLEKGTLFFKNWETITIRKFDSDQETWSDLNLRQVETLEDLPEIIFFDSNVFLRGFSKQSDQWLEWGIINTKMHAEFE